MTDRDEFLATEVLLWVADVRYNQTKYIESLPCGGVRYRDADCWHPGEDWSQTGMILEAMEKDGWDCHLTILSGLPRHAMFRRFGTVLEDVAEAEADDLREAIATAAARAKGWEG